MVPAAISDLPDIDSAEGHDRPAAPIEDGLEPGLRPPLEDGRHFRESLASRDQFEADEVVYIPFVGSQRGRRGPRDHDIASGQGARGLRARDSPRRPS